MDDILIFAKVDMRECEGIMEILNKYGAASGQCINSEKSSIMLSPNMTEQEKQQIRNIFGIQSEVFAEKYLGLPSMV